MVTSRRINGRVTSTREFEAEYPFSPHFLNINGHLLHYLDEGAGPPVVMVHGNPTWSFYFRHQVTRLSKEFRTLVPDHIGCGFPTNRLQARTPIPWPPGWLTWMPFWLSPCRKAN